MTRGELRFCPECRRPWPKGAEFDLRSFRWLDDLPRRVSPSNIDCIVHDGGGGRSRFLILETKGPNEPMEAGQGWLLRELAGLSDRVVVRVLHGNTDKLAIHEVTRTGIDTAGTSTTPAAVRSSVASWLEGSPWSVAAPKARLAATPEGPFIRCGSYSVDGERCEKREGHPFAHVGRTEAWPPTLEETA